MKQHTLLIFGDLLAMAIVTVIGFATHGETDLSFLPRMLASFVPLTLAWFLAAPWLRLFQAHIIASPRQLWRVPLAMLFAGPLAAVLRAFWLGGVVIPIFVAVFTATSALGMLGWRALWLAFARRR